MPRQLWKTEVFTATTTIPWTRNFRHLLPVPRHWLDRASFSQPSPNVVPPKDRIKYWNIVPGDQIRIRGEESGKMHEVLSINRFTNRVFLKGAIVKQATKHRGMVTKSVHYSQCQLFIGHFEPALENPDGNLDEQPALVPVFAERISIRRPSWRPHLHRYEWERYAEQTTPHVGGKHAVIPWPKVPPRETPKPNIMLDTTESAVKRITYVPPQLPQKWDDPEPTPAHEGHYINSLFRPFPLPGNAFDKSTPGPMEPHLVNELSNLHSRAKKQARWQAASARRAVMYKQFVARETQDLRGRTVREARAEAAWKYRQSVEEERKADKKRRWMTAERTMKMRQKRARKAKKEEKEKERLNRLVLIDGPKQVLPRRLQEPQS